MCRTSVEIVLTEEDEMIITLCLIIISVAMQNLEIPQLICSINFLRHAIFVSAFQNLA